MDKSKGKQGAPAQALKITDLTLRDGHQSLLATRMRTEDMALLAPGMNKVGFQSVEVWGGATFDVATRFLNEDPWDRVRSLKRLMPDTPLQMLLRGQNLVGYRNYPDDVVAAFIEHSAEVGIDIFRVFDAVNDERNFEVPFKVIKKCGKHIQASICYSLTERKLGGAIYSIDYYIKKARLLQEMGADSLCVKDMAGLISPDDAYSLVQALKQAVRIPVLLHTHYTSGMASMSCLKAAEAGVDAIDTVLSPFALRSSHPAVEPMVVALQGTPRDTGLDLKLLFELGQKLEDVAPKYRDFLDTTKMAVIDTGVLVHQIPGGMFTNLVSQLREAGALDRLHEVFEELPRTRRELGFPPLVTPTSQIVGTQAVQNVLFGRYEMISDQVKDYAYGLYGKPPAPIDPEVQKKALKGYHRGEKPITCRAADVLEPELEKAREATKGIARDIGDVLTYALYPTTGLRFLKWKYGLEAPPPEVKAKSLEEVKREDELIAKAKSGRLVEKQVKAAPAKGAGIRTFSVFLDDEYYKVEIEPAGGASVSPALAGKTPAAVSRPPQPGLAKEVPQEVPRKAVVPFPPALAPSRPPAKVMVGGKAELLAPMPGIIVRYEVRVGDEVKAGDTIAVLEAMKMENALPCPVAGKVMVLNYKPGDRVARNDVLAVIG